MAFQRAILPAVLSWADKLVMIGKYWNTYLIACQCYIYYIAYTGAPSKYVITLGLEVDGETTETIGVEDKSILTYDGVRELLFTNRQIMEYMRTFGLDGKEAQLSITLEAFQADGTPITSEAAKASKTSKIDIILGPDVELNPDLE